MTELVRTANRGGLQGAIDALEVARRLRGTNERRRQILAACQQVLRELGAVAGQLTEAVKQMPSAAAGFWVGWDGDRVIKAEREYVRVRGDFAVVAEGLQRIVGAYLELGEFASAAEAFTRVSTKINASIRQAAERARLLPYSNGGKGPERIFEDFLKGKPIAEGRLQALAEGLRPALSLLFDPSELVA